MVRLVRTLFWPELKTPQSVQGALQRAMWLCFVLAALALVGSFGLVHNVSGVLLWLAVLEVGGLVLIGFGIGAGSRLAAIAAAAISAANLLAACFLFRQHPALLYIEAVVLLVLVAAVRAAFTLEPAQQASWWRSSRLFLSISTGIVASALLLSVALLLAFRAFVTPTSAMQPTLRIGDRFVVLLPALMGPVHRGDLVVLHMPGPNPSLVVKRVVGLPGDRLQLTSGRLILNGKPVNEPYVLSPSSFPVMNFPASGRPLSVGPTYTPLVQAMYRNNVRNDQLVVPAGMYFVLGDNRGNSLDSRYFGPIPTHSIAGRPVYVYASAKATPTPPHALKRYSIGS